MANKFSQEPPCTREMAEKIVHLISTDNEAAEIFHKMRNGISLLGTADRSDYKFSPAQLANLNRKGSKKR